MSKNLNLLKKHKIVKPTRKELRLIIHGALQCGVKPIEIQRRLNVSLWTIRKVKNKGIGRKKRKDAGKSRKITPDLAKKLTKIFKGKKAIGVKRVGKLVDLKSPTIRRWLSTKPWGQYLRPVKKLYLSERNISDRKKFYYRIRKFGINNVMKSVAFSDEMPAKLRSCMNPSNQGVRDFKKNRPSLVVFKHNPISLHVWGFISGKGSSDLLFIDGKTSLNSKTYAKILKFAKKQMSNLELEYLQEDGAPSHTSKSSCAERVKLGIKVFLKKENGLPGSFFWPGNSPDLNVIENAWSLLKFEIDSLKRPPKTPTALKNSIKKIWEKHRKNGCHANLIKSFKKRMTELKRNNFKDIDY